MAIAASLRRIEVIRGMVVALPAVDQLVTTLDFILYRT